MMDVLFGQRKKENEIVYACNALIFVAVHTRHSQSWNKLSLT